MKINKLLFILYNNFVFKMKILSNYQPAMIHEKIINWIILSILL